jgi:hypothetical protein
VRGRVGEALVEEVAEALECDERVCVPCDCLDESDVCTGCNQATNAGVAEVVEAVDRFRMFVDEVCVA